MYLHLGQDVTVSMFDVVGIFDLDATVTGETTRDFFAAAEAKGLIVNISEEIPKSFVVCSQMNKVTVYISQLSASTLKKRAADRTFAWEEA